MPAKAKTIAGLVLHILLGGLVAASGVFKLVSMNNPEFAAEMAKKGLEGRAGLLGVGELIAGVLLIIPRTNSLGLLLMSGFWGGVIAFHMSHGEELISGSVMLLLTWVGAFLRDPRAFYSFLPKNDPLG